MDWMRGKIKLSKGYSDKEEKEFELHNSQVILGRIRMLSLATIFFALFWGYMDYHIVKNGADEIFVTTLITGHIISVAVSVVIVIFYNKLDGMIKEEACPVVYGILKAYVFLYILVGSISSINSQRYTGNIYSYIILSLVVAIAIPLKPSYMFAVYVGNHIIFLAGLRSLSHERNIFLANTMNATVLMGVAFVLGSIFYHNRLDAFLYHKKLLASRENFKKLFHLTPYPVFIVRVDDGKILKVNKKACSLLEIHLEGLEVPLGVDRFIREKSLLALQEEVKKHDCMYNQIVEFDLNGKLMWVTASYEVIDYNNEKCVLASIMDITEIRKTEEELTRYASIDPLTGILNRRMGIQNLEKLLEQSKENYLEFVLCFLDINNLKEINDTYGHNEGDRYILMVCDIIKRNLQEEDVLFRMGGDEFIIILMNRNISQAEKLWEEVRQQFSAGSLKEEVCYSIMASHGLCYYQSGMETNPDSIIEKADKQMYIEKQKFKRVFTKSF